MLRCVLSEIDCLKKRQAIGKNKSKRERVGCRNDMTGCLNDAFTTYVFFKFLDYFANQLLGKIYIFVIHYKLYFN